MPSERDDLFDKLLSQGPSQSTISLVLTEMQKEGRHGEVIETCLKALTFYPDDVRLRTLLAESYVAQGSLEPAEAELNHIASKVGELISAFKLQARLFLQQNRIPEAREALRRYLAYDPKDEEALSLIADIEAAGRESVEEAPPFLEEDLPTPQAIDAESVPEEDLPSPQPFEAEQDLEELAPQEVVEGKKEELFSELATPTLAEIYFSQGQIREAINTYEVVLSNNPSDAASADRLAELKRQVGRPKKIERPAPGGPDGEDRLREKRQKLASALEGWLPRIRELNNGK